MASEEIKLSTNGKQLGKLRKISYIFQNLANFGPQTAEIILQVYPHSGSFRIFLLRSPNGTLCTSPYIQQ